MYRSILFAAAVAAGCTTPYQQKGLFGEGYSDKELGDGTYLVEVSVNQFTSRGTALEYVHQRAGELCPEGYVLKDSASGEDFDYTGKARGSEIAAIVECTAPEPAAEAAPASPTPRAGAGFFCTSSPTDSTIGACARTVERCRDRQSAFAEGGVDVGPCKPVDTAVCVTATRVADSKVVTWCTPTVLSCKRQRDDVAAKGDAYASVTECEDAE
jgi:hypothetical protein